MQIDLENRQANAESTRSVKSEPAPVGTPHVKEIGPHEHSWEFYGRSGADGGTYQVCQLCDARRVADVPLAAAAHQDWINGHADWKPTEDERQPVVAVAIPTAYQAAAAATDGDDDEDGAKPAPRRGRPPKKQD